MKRFLIVFSLFGLILSNAAAQVSAAQAELSFTFTRQTGFASNQFAVWIEDAQGNYVKTLYATRYTAKGGYKSRPTSIPQWVKKSGLSALTREQVDAISAATPKTGEVSYAWDGTNAKGALVQAGAYVIKLEATLRNESQVYYSAPFTLGKGVSVAAVSVEYVGPDLDKEKSMVSNVKVKVLR